MLPVLNGIATILMHNNCDNTFLAGDMNNDDKVDITDLDYLVNFIVHQGPQPAGGPQRADCNCDNHLNIADIVYFMNYIFRKRNSSLAVNKYKNAVPGREGQHFVYASFRFKAALTARWATS